MKKEIVVVAEHFTTGGAERVLSELCFQWCKEGHRVYAVLIRPNKYMDSYELPENMEIVNLYSCNNRFLRRFQNMRDLIKFLKSKPEASVLSFVEPAMLIVAMCSFFIKNKIVFSERCDPNNNPPQKRMRIVRDLIFNLADICVFQTEDAKSYFSKSIQKKGVIIPNPINPYLPDPYLGPRRKAIVYVGRNVPQKNIPMLLDAFGKFVIDHPEYNLEMYGRDIDSTDFKQELEKRRIANNVILKGFCLDVLNQIRDAQLYVSSSDYEGISNSMLEALAMGIPTIVTDCPAGGARQVIENGVNGILVPVRDSETLYLSMKKVVENPELSQKMSKDAIQVREKYPVSSIANEWLKIF